MRYIAESSINKSRVKRLMLYEHEDGVYLFEYDILHDGPSTGDFWFENLKTAFETCRREYGVELDQWQEIPDPLEHCQHDWIEPVRIAGRAEGKPRWGRYEKLIDGEWVELNLDGE
ncbi:MAG: hypothetical protein GF388_03695 [Candidatus Aegiribacteria sp.]|nr:hypothetical protein [Candidatus Aegiribacteria sp.]